MPAKGSSVKKIRRANDPSSVKKKTMRDPPNVHECSRRHALTRGERDTIVSRLERHPIRLSSRIDHLKGTDVIRGGSDEANAIYPRLFWEKNETSSHLPVDYKRLPLDLLIVKRRAGAPSFFVDDPAYKKTVAKYRLLDASCIVCTPKTNRTTKEKGYSIICVFVTEVTVPSFARLHDDARRAQDEARENLKPRHSFAVGGDYARDPDYKDKRANVMQERMNGTIWNDGLQTWTTATPGWQGMYFTQYFRRRPGTSPVEFAHPYVGMYATERLVVPAVARLRLKMSQRRDDRATKVGPLPSAFKALPLKWMPATQVGISDNFSVKTHNDSCIAGVTESIFWANRNLKRLRFAVTSCDVMFDIGKQPCLLFMKGNEMHGTVPGGTGSCGLVLISKRNTLQQFEQGAYTDLTRAKPTTRRGGRYSKTC